MKKFFLLFVGLLLLASPAFALQCKDGGSLNGDECWTDVYVSPIETSPTTVGTVVVYDFSAGTAEKAAYQVRVASASTDGYRVAGVVQKVIATGDWGRVLVRGKGKLRTVNILSSGDRLVVSPAANFGAAGPTSTGSGGLTASRDGVIAYALEASTATSATIDAYITVV